jgi:PKD repeat protein
VKNSFRRDVGPRALVAALAALLPLALATPAQASTDTVDQSLVLSNAFSSQSGINFMAQTFTAGLSGGIDRVSLPVSTLNSFGKFTVSIYSVSSGKPTATALGSAPTFSGTLYCCSSWIDFAFSPSVSVTSGTMYAIVIQRTLGSVRWNDSGTANLYAAGAQWLASSATTWALGSHQDFGFKELVVTNVNTPPAVAADRAALSVNEGTAPYNTGTCSDPDGDAISLAASSGTVTPCTGGTWSWSGAAGDETPTQTVTITADDGHGLTASTSFTLDVVPVDPIAQILSDPPSITVPEGTNVPFSGAATSPASEDTSAGFKYAWTVTDNGATYASGSGASFSFVPKDDGSYLVTFTATDDGGMSGATSMTVIATNVAPTAAITGVVATAPLVTTAFETLNFSGHFTDADTADNYTITWSFGDGSSATGLNVSHAYSLPGTYTVKFQVSDGEGGVGQATTTVIVQTTQQALDSIEAYVQSLPGLNAGQKNSLIAKLQNAAAAAARGDNNAASNELNAFLNELQADVNAGNVSTAAAGTLRTAVHTVQGSLGTFNRLVGWWPLEA